MKVTLPKRAIERMSAFNIDLDNTRVLLSSVTSRLGDIEKLAGYGAEEPNLADALPLEHNELRKQQIALQFKHSQLMMLKGSIDQFLNHAPSLIDAAPVKVKLEKGETVEGAVDRVRKEAADIRNEIANARIAPLPLDERKAKIREHVLALADEGAPTIDTSNGDVQIRFAIGGIVQKPTSVLLAWLDPEKMIARLEEQMCRRPGRIQGLTTVERRDLIRSLTDQLDQLNRTEVALVDKAIAAGIEIFHRHDIAIDAFLGVTVKSRLRVAA